MSRDDWQQVSDLIDGALAQPEESRGAWLAEVCAGDGALARRVSEILAGENEPGDALAQSIGAVCASALGWGDVASGDLIGPYKVLRLIGRGGMGEVYAAEDPRLGRQLALKLLPALDGSDGGRVRRFQLEARAASALNHPNIVTIYDIGEMGGRYYIASELVHGRTLRQAGPAGRMSAAEAVEIAIQLASALAAAHEAGIVHRDIKPDNVMVRPDGYVKVLDFGLAKLRDGSAASATALTDLTGAGVVIGTTRYMSPEQARGGELDARTDIFSAGVVLYELLTGRSPFAGETAADVVAAILDQEPQPVTDLAPEVPPEFSEVVRKCLRKRPDERYATSQELLADLRQVRQGMHPSSVSGRVAVPPAKRFPYRWALAAGILAAAAGGFLFFKERDSGPFRTPRVTKTVLPGVIGFGVISPDGRYIAYTDRRPGGLTAVNVRLIASNSAVEVVPPERVSYWSVSFSGDSGYLYCVSQAPDAPTSVGFRVPALGGARQKVAEGVAGMGVAPDGQKIYLGRRDSSGSSISIANADGSQPVEVYRSNAEYAIQSAVWSPDSQDLIFTESDRQGDSLDSRIYAVRQGAPPRLLLDVGKLFLVNVSPLPGGAGFLASARYPGALPQIYALSRTGRIHQVTHDFNDYNTVVLSQDGKRLLAGASERRSQVWVVGADGSKSVRALTEPERRVDQPIFLRNGRILAARAGNGQSQLWTMNADGSNQTPLLPNDSLVRTQPNACPDRDVVVFATRSGAAWDIFRANVDGSELKQITFGVDDQFPTCLTGGIVEYFPRSGRLRVKRQVTLAGGPANAPAEMPGNASPDGQYQLITHNRAGGLAASIVAKDGRTVAQFAAARGLMTWAPDSRGIAYLADPEGVRNVWYQPISGGPPAQLTNFETDQEFFSLSWSPDSRRIVCARGSIFADLFLIEDTDR